jgi:hypothetical protein
MPHLCDLVRKATGVDRIAIMQQIAWSTVSGKGLGDLVCRPIPTGMGGDIEVNYSPSLMNQHDENVQ